MRGKDDTKVSIFTYLFAPSYVDRVVATNEDVAPMLCVKYDGSCSQWSSWTLGVDSAAGGEVHLASFIFEYF